MPDHRLRWLLASSTLSNLGDGIGKIAFPLLAVNLTRDPLLIAGLSATQFLPWLLFAVLAGALVDRVDRRHAMILANLVRAVVVGLTAVLVLADAQTIWLVYLAALLIGTAETVADSAANVLIPSVVERDRLASANGKLQAAEIVGQTFLGGPVGSATFALFSALPFLLNSAGFAIAAALLLGMAGSYRPRTVETAEPVRLRVELADGLRWLRGNVLFLRLLVLAGLLSLTSELAQAQLVLYALEELDLSEAAFGFYTLAGGIGGLIGAAAAPRLLHVLSRFNVLAGGVACAGLGFTGMGLVLQPALSALFFALFAAAVVSVNVVIGTLRHLLIPGELLGRVLGVWRTVVWGMIPAGALLGGLLTRWFGNSSAIFLVSGIAQLLLAVALVATLHRFRSAMEESTGHG